MSQPSAASKLTDLHRRLGELAEKTRQRQPWNVEDQEAIVTGMSHLALLVQELVLESKKPMREVPVLPKRGF